jgi:hypothetical protein
MKIIQYKLNSNGSVPEYIIDGGLFSCAFRRTSAKRCGSNNVAKGYVT